MVNSYYRALLFMVSTVCAAECASLVASESPTISPRVKKLGQSPRNKPKPLEERFDLSLIGNVVPQEQDIPQRNVYIDEGRSPRSHNPFTLPPEDEKRVIQDHTRALVYAKTETNVRTAIAKLIHHRRTCKQKMGKHVQGSRAHSALIGLRKKAQNEIALLQKKLKTMADLPADDLKKITVPVVQPVPEFSVEQPDVRKPENNKLILEEPNEETGVEAEDYNIGQKALSQIKEIEDTF